MQKKHHGILSMILAAAVVVSNIAIPNIAYADSGTYNTGGAVSTDEEVVAYVNFGTETECKGMKVWMGEEPDITVTNKQGREGWVLDPVNKEKNAYIYFDVDDDVAKNVLDGSSYRVEVDYFDESISSLVLSYDPYDPVPDAQEGYSYGALYYKKKITPREIELFDFTDTQTWKTYSWFLKDPSFGGNMTDGADFRIGAHGYNMGYSRGSTPPVVGSVRLIKTNTKSIANISVSSDKLGNNFFTGEEVKLNVEIDNSYNQYESRSVGDYDADVTYSAYDSLGNLYAQKTETVKMQALGSTKTEVTFDIDKYDTYSLIVEVENKDKHIYNMGRSVFAYCKDASEHQNFSHGIGLAANICDNNMGSYATHELVKMIKQAGFGLIRMHFTGFYELHQYYEDGYNPANITWYKESYREFMRLAKEAGLDILTYNGSGIPLDSSGSEYPLNDMGRETYTKMFNSLIDVIGDTSDKIEIWNEMNGNAIPLKEGETKGDVYAALCKYLYPRVKEKHPDYTLIGMVPSNVQVGREGEVFFDDAFKAGAADYMDLVSVHYYQLYGGHFTYDFFSEAQNTIDIAHRNGYYGPIWVTETGSSSHYTGVDTEEAQATQDVQGYIILQENNYFERIYSFNFLDSHYDRDRTERESNFGCLEGEMRTNEIVEDGEVNYSAKPKLLGFANLNSLTYDADWQEKVMFDDVTGGYRFKRSENGTDLLALFSEKPQTSVSLDLGTNKVKVYDFYGNESEIVSNDGKYTFDIDSAVCYVEGNFGKFEVAETSSVRPEMAYIETDCGEEHTIRLENNTNKTLTAEVKLLDKSQISCDTMTLSVPKGGADLVLRAGSSAPDKSEPVRITMKDGDDVYFDGDVVMYMVPKVSMDANAAIENGEWNVRVTLNNTSNTDISGYIEFATPTELTESSRQRVTLKANETKDFDIKLDEAYTKSDFHAMIRFVSDVENSNPIYVDKTFNFEYASKAVTPPAIDGDLSEWDRGWINMNNTQNYKSYIGYFTPYFGLEDMSAKCNFMWDDENFYFAAEVTDDVFCCEGETLANAWKLDGIQLGLVLYRDDMSLGKDFEEIMLVNYEGTPTVYRFMSKFETDDITKVNNAELAITQSDDKTKTYYEFKCPWVDLIPKFRGIQAGDDMLVSVCINDNDGEGGRAGAMLYGGGIEDTKQWGNFKRIYINDR